VRSGRAARLLLGVVALPVLGFWLFGAVIFLRADGVVDYTLPRREHAPAGEHNLASYRYGPRVRASSYFRDSHAHHHPMWLVDEQPMPSLIAKWACSERDRRPWLSVAWREPRRLERVRIQHAGAFERPEFTARSYRLRCLLRDGIGSELIVRGNRAAFAEHRFVCDGALGVRIDFVRRGARADIVRVFEVEAWGR
jgi:hypothetical protein